MQHPKPIARAQQVIGMPEHPCETIVRNGAMICQYEEMEVRFFPEHSGLYLATLLGEPFEIFGLGDRRAEVSLMDGYLPVVQSETIQKGCKIKQTAFACLLEGDRVKDGTETLINMVKLKINNLSEEETIKIPVTILFGSCFRQPLESDPEGERSYWKDFLLRDDIAGDLLPDKEIQLYPYPLKQEDNTLIAENKGMIFLVDNFDTLDCGFIEIHNEGTWKEGKKFNLGWRINIELKPEETKEFTYKVPYLPLENNCENKTKLAALDFDKKLKDIKKLWNLLLNEGAALSIPGTSLGDLWKAQTAATFILVDKQNKGDENLFGREMINKWAGNYPDKVLSYVHLSPTLYEFIWSQEAGYWVIGALDMQGYHDKAEEYLELFFELQGKGVPGVHNVEILPDSNIAKSFMGTTPHAWLNSNGGVLYAMAEHYKLTRNKDWVIKHKDAIISACRWIKELRKTTQSSKYTSGYGLMPEGQSTDSTFASDHMQWYYTDIWSLTGLDQAAQMLKECQIEEADEYLAEVEDYKKCMLRSIDSSILSIQDFKNEESEYDYSSYLYSGPLHFDKIIEWDEKGVPVCFKGKIILKDEAEKLGIKMFVPMSPQTRIPFRVPYLDHNFVYVYGFLSGILDFSSEKPIFDGAQYSGKDIWDSVIAYCRICGIFDIQNDIFSCGLPYNDYLIKKFLHCEETGKFNDALSFVLRYGCDKETHMGKETAGIYQSEMWFQPCPFTLSMATMRQWLRKTIAYEDEIRNKLIIGYAIKREWMENAATFEKPISLNNIATYYGHMSVEYTINFICSEIKVKVTIPNIGRLSENIEIRLNHPQSNVVQDVTVTGITNYEVDKIKGIISCSSKAIDNIGAIEIIAAY